MFFGNRGVVGGPGLKPLLFGRFFVGLKPHANPEKQKQRQKKGKGNDGRGVG